MARTGGWSLPGGADVAARQARAQAIAQANAAAIESIRLEQQPVASGYNGGAPAAPAAAGPAGLGTDPAYLAFQRALGLEDSTDATNNQLAIDALNRRAGMSLADIAAQGGKSRQNIADSYETRGMLRSGDRLRAQAEQQEGQSRQEASVVAGQADDTARLVSELATRRASRARGTAERSFGSAGGIVAESGY